MIRRTPSLTRKAIFIRFDLWLSVGLLSIILSAWGVVAQGGRLDPRQVVTLLPKDTVPAILDPTPFLVSADMVSSVRDSDQVLGVVIGEESRAYPIAFLSWHEIVNDTVRGLPIVVTSDLQERLPLNVEEVLYRISQEALHNVVKHAAARQVTLAIDRVRGGLRLRIADDGKGFDQSSVPDGHLGLAGMRARAEKIGAAMSVSSKPGSGTTIEVFLPDGAIEQARDADPVRSQCDPLHSGLLSSGLRR